MSDPRDVLSQSGVRAENTSFKFDSTIVFNRLLAGGSAQVGLAVTRTSTDDTVALANDNDVIAGKLVSVEAGVCVVQTAGFCTLPGGNGATLTIGGRILGALNASSERGYIKVLPETVSASPTQAEVQHAFRATKSRGIIRNNDVTTAVVVELI